MWSDILSGTVPVLVQGASGRTGQRHLQMMRGYGTCIVAGVSRRADLSAIAGVPVFPTCHAAVAATGARVSVAFVPAVSIEDAVCEALEAGIKLIVTVAEGMPVHDAARTLRRVQQHDAVWVGPSTPGLAVPGVLKLGFLPDIALAPGPLAVLSKSGTLSYECCYRLVERGIGQSLWIGVGGELVKGTRFGDVIPFLKAHDSTEALVVVGEIGGTEEEELAEAIRETGFAKPCFVLVAGSMAPEGRTMGHAGALIHGAQGTYESKRVALEAAGAAVLPTIDALVDAVAARLPGRTHS